MNNLPTAPEAQTAYDGGDEDIGPAGAGADLEADQWHAVPDLLDPDRREAYFLRMLVRLLRQALTILVVSTYLGATMLAAAFMADAAPAPMNGMIHARGGMGDKMPCQGTVPGCTTEIGCIFLVSLPPTQLTLATTIVWSSVHYSVSPEFLDGRSIKPALDPPISRA
jgi:hypothetical protein